MKNLEAITGIKDIGKLLAFIDASFAVHINICSHTCSTITFSTRIFSFELKIKKLNTKSFTNTKIIRVSNLLSKVLSIYLFLEAQYYFLTKNIIYQDNKSVIKLKVNRCKSFSMYTRHINIYYFYMKDLVDNNII